MGFNLKNHISFKQVEFILGSYKHGLFFTSFWCLFWELFSVPLFFEYIFDLTNHVFLSDFCRKGGLKWGLSGKGGIPIGNHHFFRGELLVLGSVICIVWSSEKNEPCHHTPFENLCWLFLLVQKKTEKNKWIFQSFKQKWGSHPGEMRFRWVALQKLAWNTRSRPASRWSPDLEALGKEGMTLWPLKFNSVRTCVAPILRYKLIFCKHRIRSQVVNIYFAYWWHLSSSNISSSQSIPRSKGLMVKKYLKVLQRSTRAKLISQEKCARPLPSFLRR